MTFVAVFYWCVLLVGLCRASIVTETIYIIEIWSCWVGALLVCEEVICDCAPEGCYLGVVFEVYSSFRVKDELLVFVLCSDYDL